MESSSGAIDTAQGLQRRAMTFVVLMGVVSLLADMVYEGGRSIAGPYLALLGASGTVVGLAAGFGELIGYGLRLAFALLLIPGVLTILMLLVARARFPQPEDLAGTTPALATRGFSRAFWLYLAAVGLIAAGFADFSLIAFHLQRTAVLSSAWIPA